MADASGQGGVAAGLAHQAASRARDAGLWLDDRNPGQVVTEMQSFARRRPAVFRCWRQERAWWPAGLPRD